MVLLLTVPKLKISLLTAPQSAAAGGPAEDARRRATFPPRGPMGEAVRYIYNIYHPPGALPHRRRGPLRALRRTGAMLRLYYKNGNRLQNKIRPDMIRAEQ